MDYIQSVDETCLRRLAVSKGGWKECDLHTFTQALATDTTYKPPLMISGGPACNTMKGLAALGIQTAITGNLGLDHMGDLVLDVIKKSGITPLCTRGNTVTAQIVSLVTSDGERAFCVYNESEKKITAKDLKKSYFEGVDIVHVEGYRLMNGSYVETAMEMAKEAGALITFDLCNPTYGEKYRDRIYGILNEYVDVLFLERDEAYALTHFDPEKACDFLKNYCDLTIIKVGAEGCWIGQKGEVSHYAAIPTEVVDSTGSGDLFASGFIYGLLNKAPLLQCVQLGLLLSSAVVQQYGAEIQEDKWPSLREKVKLCSSQ